jgi:predicted NAD/FAD-dependent oxidoreductase
MLYSTPMRAPTVIVVGAGVSGLACAGELGRRGIPALVLERSRGVGGRCATRRVLDDQPVDHGLPFLHANSHEFGVALNALDPSGKIPGWPLEVRGRRLACLKAAFTPGNRRMARREGVNAFPRHLARGLDVRRRSPVTALRDAGPRVAVAVEDGAVLEAPIVVLATELPVAVALAAPLVSAWPGAAGTLERLRAIEPIPALAVIAGYATRAFDAPFEMWYPLETTMLHMVSHDSSKREGPRHPVLVLHGRPRFSRERLDAPAEAWSAELLWEAGELLGAWAARPAWRQTHVWRHARVRERDQVGDPVGFESPGGARVAMIGDAFASTPGLEGAYLSGIQMGEQVAMLLGTVG